MILSVFFALGCGGNSNDDEGNRQEQELKAKAAEYLKAAEQGDAEAQFSLGVCYFGGLGVEQSYIEAVKWYRKAAEQGDAGAQISLGWSYENGYGVEKSYTKAVKWYSKAAEQELAKSFTEAVEWLGKASEQGLPEAQRKLRELNYY